MEQRISANDYRSKQLSEVADAGLDYAIAWITTNNPNWIADPSDASREIDDDDLSVSFDNGLQADIQFSRPVSTLERVTITSTASQPGGGTSTAVSQTQILQRKLLSGPPTSPIVVNGCINNATGTPDISNLTGGGEPDIVTSQPGACIDTAHPGFTDTDDGTVDIEDNAFTGSAWNRTFGLTPGEMRAMALAQESLPIGSRDILWVDDSNIGAGGTYAADVSGATWHTDLGATGDPVLVVYDVTNCLKINGTTIIYGIVFIFGPCDASGWGGGTIRGSLIVDGDIPKINANTELIYDQSYLVEFLDDTDGVDARIPGSWIDM